LQEKAGPRAAGEAGVGFQIGGWCVHSPLFSRDAESSERSAGRELLSQG
jgi:hypothetical protein